MAAQPSTPTGRHWTAAELRKLPPEERVAVLEAAAPAQEEYRARPELADFEAFGTDDLRGESSRAEAR